MTRTTNRALAALLAALFALAQAVGVGVHEECIDGSNNRCAPSVTLASASYDELMAQQDAFIQTVSFRTVSLAASASYDELMAQQQDLFQAMADRDTALAASASSDDLMVQQDASIEQISTPDSLN